MSCCWTNTLPYRPMPNPYNDDLYRNGRGWTPPNPFNMSEYVLEHYRPNPNAYCCPGYQAPPAPISAGPKPCCGKNNQGNFVSYDEFLASKEYGWPI